MRLVERIQSLVQVRRRRVEQPPVQFALGVAPRPQHSPPRIHPCKKGVSTLSTMKPLVSFSPHIPYNCLISIMMFGCSLKEFHESLEVQRQSILSVHPSDLQESLWKTFHEKERWCRIETKCRVAFRILVSRWLFKRYGSNLLNTEDPATLCEPDQPIHVYDASARGTYVFEAKSLQKSMERDLNYCDWLFPEPFHPKNPLTNLPFHSGHRIYILQQLRTYQLGSWILESYRQTKWNLRSFRDIFLVPLKTRALQEICRNPTSEETIDYLLEFIEDHYDYHETHRPEILTVLKWSVKNKPTDVYILDWLDAFKRFYSIQIIYGEHYLENNLSIQRTLYGITKKLLTKINEINRLAKIRNDMIQDRRRQRTTIDTQPNQYRLQEIETIHGPVSLISEFQTLHLPLANPIIVRQPAVLARFELGDTDIDALTERVSHLVDEWNHANS